MKQESKNCPRSTQALETRMFVTLFRLGAEVSVPGLDVQLVKGLMHTSRKLTPQALRYMLSLDAGFVERTGAEINDGLRSRAEEMMKDNSKGGE